MLRGLGKVAAQIYKFTEDSGMVALMSRVPAAQEILKACHLAYACWGGAALEMQPPSEEELAAMHGAGWGGLFKTPPQPPLQARLTVRIRSLVRLSYLSVHVH